MLCVARSSCVPSSTFITLALKNFSVVRAQTFAHMPGSHDISQSVSTRRARDGGAHRVVLQPCAATSVSHNSLPKPSVWVPGREFDIAMVQILYPQVIYLDEQLILTRFFVKNSQAVFLCKIKEIQYFDF